MKKTCFFLLILAVLLFSVSCEQKVHVQNVNDHSGQTQSNDVTPNNTGSEPVAPTTEPQISETIVSIIGAWHYEKSAKDCYIAFYSDGTGIIHYYQDYGAHNNLTGYVNKGIRSWSYSPESNYLGITIAGATIAGINSDEQFTFLVTELTENNLVITNSGAYDSAVPINKNLTRE